MADTQAPPPPELQLGQLIFGKWISMAVSVAAKLRIADRLHAGPQSTPELAQQTQTHAPSLYRVLRALASVGVFQEMPDGRFAQTAMSEFLRTGVAGSMRGVADYCGADWSWRAWGQLGHSVRTGETAFNAVFGEPIFDYLGKHPEESAVFNEGMTGFSSVMAPAVAEAYDFSRFHTLVDVGGGHGLLLRTILNANAMLNGILYDSPHVVVGAQDAIQAAGLANRCRAIGGDFFQNVPSGGDAYILKHIIHDWPDPQATTILKNCRSAGLPQAKLILVEMVVQPGNVPDVSKFLDLEMLAIASGKERTEQEYRELLAGAGWKLLEVRPTKSPAFLVIAE
jgi:hypothetical protein